MRAMAKMGFAGLVMAALSMGGAATAETGTIQITRIPLTLGTSVALGCANPGSHQDVGKTPVITNTTGAPLKAGMNLQWSSSDGDKGSIKLAADLAPGASVKGLGTAGQAYSCTSAFFSNPDLVVKNVHWTTAANVAIDVANLDPWVAAGSSVTHFELVACSGQVLKTFDAAPMTLAKGEVKTINVAANMLQGKTYFRAKADAKSQVLERNETNNAFDSMNSCLY